MTTRARRRSSGSALRLAGAAMALLPWPGPAEAGPSVPVASVTIYPGNVIRDGMLTERELPDGFPGQAATVLDRGSIVGRVARRTLLPGLPIPSNAIGEPKVVALGAMVRVTFVEGGLTISTYASALQAGGVGDTIPVRNLESGLTISGTIEGDGSVRVGSG